VTLGTATLAPTDVGLYLDDKGQAILLNNNKDFLNLLFP
jgi:hypothetical protein